jgi:hypothetical protein
MLSGGGLWTSLIEMSWLEYIRRFFGHLVGGAKIIASVIHNTVGLITNVVTPLFKPVEEPRKLGPSSVDSSAISLTPTAERLRPVDLAEEQEQAEREEELNVSLAPKNIWDVAYNRLVEEEPRFKQTVGSIIALFDTLSTTALTELLGLSPAEIKETLEHLYSILNIPEEEISPIQLLRLSFRDFVLDKARCPDPQLWIDEKKTHNDLFTRCLCLMSDRLKRDVCDLRRPGTLASGLEKGNVESRLPTAVQYACRYWVAHLREAEIGLRDDDRAHTFLQKNFLHWLEALSLIGKTYEGVLAITSLGTFVIVSELGADLAGSG